MRDFLISLIRLNSVVACDDFVELFQKQCHLSRFFALLLSLCRCNGCRLRRNGLLIYGLHGLLINRLRCRLRCVLNGCCFGLSRSLDDGCCVDLLVSCVKHCLSGRFCVEHNDLVAKNRVLVGFDNACNDVFAVCFQVSDKRGDVAVSVDKEETVDVGELSKSCRVDNLTKVEFAFSLFGKRRKCVVTVFLDELAVVFGTFCGISVEFARCDFTDTGKFFKSGFKHAERNSDAFDVCKNYIFFACCHNLLLLFQVAQSGLVIVFLY